MLAWEIGVRLLPRDVRRFIPTIAEMVFALPGLWKAHLLQALAASITRITLGFAVASVIGVIVGTAIGLSRVLRVALMPIINFARTVPSAAIIPVVMSTPLLGLNERSFYVVIVFGSIWPVLFSTASGVAGVSQTARDTSRLLPLSPARRLRHFTLPEAAPEIFTGLQLSLGVSVILTITSEMLIGGSGLGYLLHLQETDSKSGFAMVLVIAILGWLLTTVSAAVEKMHPWLRHLRSTHSE